MKDYQAKAYQRILDLVKAGYPRVVVNAPSAVGAPQVVEEAAKSPELRARLGVERVMDVLCLGADNYMGDLMARELTAPYLRNVVTTSASAPLRYKGKTVSGSWDLVVINQCVYPNAMQALKTYKEGGMITDKTVVLYLMIDGPIARSESDDPITVMPLGDTDLTWLGAITP